MSDRPARQTHFMTFPYSVSGLRLPDWTTVLTVNGEVVADIPIELVENPSGFYTFSFDNDGTDYSTVTLIVYETNGTNGFKFGETWEVRKKTTELNVKQIRARQDSDGGFFKSSYGEES